MRVTAAESQRSVTHESDEGWKDPHSRHCFMQLQVDMIRACLAFERQ